MTLLVRSDQTVQAKGRGWGAVSRSALHLPLVLGPPGSARSRRYTEGIQNMLDHYHVLVGTLNSAETALLDDHSQELLRVFRSGFKRLNWNSLGDACRRGRAGGRGGSGFRADRCGRQPVGSLSSSRRRGGGGDGDEVGAVCSPC